MEDKRIYALVPQTVQILHQAPPVRDEYDIPGIDEIVSVPMVHGRLIAQGVHVGRMLGHFAERLKIPYESITTIVLAVRNSRELRKVSTEVLGRLSALKTLNPTETLLYEEFHDTNFGLYGTRDRVHTITAFGPVTRESVENAIGHLDLY